MAIFDGSGNQLFRAFKANGDELNKAFDANGDVIFSLTSTALKVMEYNVGQWYTGGGDNVPSSKDAEYYALHNGMIQSADADILFICEYWNNMSKLPRTAVSMLEQYYPYIESRSGSSGYYGRAICSKYPLSNYTNHIYSGSSVRYYDSAEVTINGTPITLVVTHLDTDQAKREAQAVELFNYLGTLDRFIVAGDFNVVMNNADDIQFISNYTRYIKAGYNLANGGALGFINTHAGSNNTPANGGCLDNIITSSNIDITSVTTDTTKYTDNIDDYVDHIPLIAELAVY